MHNLYNSVTTALFTVCFLFFNAASAHSLIEIFNFALVSDPTLQSAKYEKVAGSQNDAIGLAGLLPNISGSYGSSQNNAERTTTYSNGIHVNDAPRYESKQASIAIRQSLINMESWYRYKGSQAQVNLSEAKYSTDVQDLISRVTSSYLEVSIAENQLLFLNSQYDAYRENQLMNDLMLEKGAGTRTDMLETRARLELAEAQLIEARDNIFNKRNELAIIAGREIGSLDSLSDTVPNLLLDHDSLLAWEQIARENNPLILSQKFTVDYLFSELERIRAANYPRADLVASQYRNTADTLYTYNQQSTVNSIGIQVSIPIYSGGGISAQIRQAAAKLDGAKSELNSITQKSLLYLRKQFQLLISSKARIIALETAVHSAKEYVTATKMSLEGGQRVNLDVLNAVQQLYNARQILASAKYNYINAYIGLHSAAGMLNEKILQRVASCFNTSSR